MERPQHDATNSHEWDSDPVLRREVAQAWVEYARSGTWDLRHGYFRDMDLRGWEFKHRDLTGADFSGANFLNTRIFSMSCSVQDLKTEGIRNLSYMMFKVLTADKKSSKLFRLRLEDSPFSEIANSEVPPNAFDMVFYGQPGVTYTPILDSQAYISANSQQLAEAQEQLRKRIDVSPLRPSMFTENEHDKLGRLMGAYYYRVINPPVEKPKEPIGELQTIAKVPWR